MFHVFKNTVKNNQKVYIYSIIFDSSIREIPNILAYNTHSNMTRIF